MTELGRSLRLEGLEPDNLLAFLALLGLLRALEASRPGWQPRAAWDLDNPPLRPMLALATPQAAMAICEFAAEGGSDARRPLRFSSERRRRCKAAERPQLYAGSRA